MPIFNKEFWIWTELLAFDNEASDQGVDAYIQRVGKVPDGIALMLSHLDIIFLHPGIEKEGVLLPIYCSRRAHDRNAVRRRQDWTNFQLRALIQALQAKGVKVFLSTFSQSLNNQYHQEWRSQFLHAMLCDIDNDGHDIADYFAKKLRETVTDYGFDGWHGADGCMSGGWFMVGNYPIVRQKMFEKFMEPLGGLDKVPEKFRFIEEQDIEGRRTRSAWVWENYPRQWQKFMTRRWTEFEAKAAAALHSVGREIMLNSCEAKSIFEAGFYFGFDTRGFGKAKVDYLLVESVATSCNLIYGTEDYPERAHQIYKCVQELTAALPCLKVITMTGVCDPVESFNSIRHAPTMLERDIYFCANQSVILPEGEKRCADGMLVCLGDSLKHEEWRLLTQFVEESVNFPAVKAEGYAWLYSDAVQDNLPDSFMKYGTVTTYLQACAMEYRGVMLPAICRSENLALIQDRPLFVPNFDLLSAEEWNAVKARAEVTVLMGNLQNCTLPENAQVAVQTPITDGYTLALIVLNDNEKREPETIAGVPQTFDMLRYFSTVRDPAPTMDINPAFWDASAKVMRELIPHPLSGSGFTLIQQDADGRRRVAIASQMHRYFVPDFALDETKEHELTLLSDYVCTDLTVKDGKLSGQGAEHIYNRIFVPPQGLFLMEDTPKQKGNS